MQTHRHVYIVACDTHVLTKYLLNEVYPPKLYIVFIIYYLYLSDLSVIYE